MDTDFVTWLTTELNKRGWSNSELARRAEIVPSAVSMVASSQRGPGLEFCVGVARAFKVPPELVLRLAGLIPPLPDDVDMQQFTRLRDYYMRLPAKSRGEVLEFAIFKYERGQDC